MPWINIQDHPDADINLPVGAAFVGDNIVCTGLSVSTGTWVNFDPDDLDVLAPPIRITIASFSMASPGAGLDYYRLGFVTRDDTIDQQQFNEESPYPAAVWGAGNISAFDPATFELNSVFAQDFSLEGSGGNATEPFDMTFLMEVFVEGTEACFWGDVVQATQTCTP